MIWECVIIGGGASGLYLASHLEIANVLLIEKKHKVGLKLGVSGSGQCNLTHGGYINQFYLKYGQDQQKFIKPVLKKHDNKAVISYYKTLGIETVEREDGKVFPSDFKAQSVIEALKHKIEANRTRLNTDEPARIIERQGSHFKVQTSKGTYMAKRVVITTGGQSYPVLGTEGDGYNLAQMLGHTISPLAPGLTGVVMGDHYIRSLTGLGFKDIHLRNSRTGMAYEGDLLATHFGLSGPVIINNSRDFKAGDLLEINWIGESPDHVDGMILEMIRDHGQKPLSYAINRFALPERLKSAVLERFKIESSMKLGQMNKEVRRLIVQGLTQYPIKIDTLQGYHDAMVTTGGVTLSEIDSKTMMSKLVPNLYFAGEVLDVDGDTGGYNLQWAFSSAYCVARSILSSIQSEAVDTQYGQ